MWRYWRASGDNALVRELWPVITRAYKWCLSTETDGDGIIENTTGGVGAIEVGAIGDALHQDIYLAAVSIQALAAMEELDLSISGGAFLSSPSVAKPGRLEGVVSGRPALGIAPTIRTGCVSGC